MDQVAAPAAPMAPAVQAARMDHRPTVAQAWARRLVKVMRIVPLRHLLLLRSDGVRKR